MSKNTFGRAVRQLKKSKLDRPEQISALLGIFQGGRYVVEVPGRHGYVYVRLRGQLSGLAMAFNESVSAVYDLPVLVERDPHNPSRYRVTGRDIGRYSDWGSSSPYLANHGSAHSFDPAGLGTDITWVYSRQFVPFLIQPSGTYGAMHLDFQPYVYYWNESFHYAGATGTGDLSAYKPSGTNARMVLVYLDPDTGNLGLTGGSEFAASLTGTADIVSQIPSLPDTGDIPLAGVRLVSGTTFLHWDNLYDVRPFFDASAGSMGIPPSTGSNVVFTEAADGWNGVGGVTDNRMLAITDGDITLYGPGSLDLGSLDVTVPGPGPFSAVTVAVRSVSNAFTRRQSISTAQAEVPLEVRYADPDIDVQQWCTNLGVVGARITGGLYYKAPIAEADDWYDYALQTAVTGTSDHFRQDAASTPDGWTEADAAADSDTDTLFSFWRLESTPGNTAYRYRRQGLANFDTSTYVDDGNWATYLFGPIMIGAGNGLEDLNHYVGVHKHASGYDEDGYVRAHLWWDSANQLWKVRGEESDSFTGGTFASPDHSGAWKTFGFPMPQPLYVAIHIHQHNAQTDDLRSRVFIGTTKMIESHEMIFDIVPTDVTVPYGQAWIEFYQSRGSLASGTSSWFYIGAYDFLETTF